MEGGFFAFYIYDFIGGQQLMIKSRTRGLVTLQTFSLLVILPSWFILLTLLTESFGREILQNQINFPLYLLGIAGACLLFLNYDNPIEHRGGGSFQFVIAVRKANTGILILALVLFGIVFATKDKAISRMFLGIYIASSWVLLLMLHRYLPVFFSRVFFRGKNTINTILAGNPGKAEKLQDWILNHPTLGMNVLGLVSYGDVEDGRLAIPILGHISEFERLLTQHKVHQVILLESRNSKAWVHYIMDTCYREGCRILILNQWEEYFDQKLTAVEEGPHTFFTLQEEPLENPVNRLLKRFLDLLVAIPIVIFLLPILMLLVKFFQIKESRGPLFYRQKRSGFKGRTFSIIKFRSMYHHRPVSGQKGADAVQASEEDERVFSFGKFMRRTSLDEFPQFINVLGGKMSVVGPRPHMTEHDEKFKRLVDIYRTRHFVKPGLTGLAQTSGYRGEITSVELIEERIRLDLQYINNWSIWLDIGLILKTIVQLISPPRSAY